MCRRDTSLIASINPDWSDPQASNLPNLFIFQVDIFWSMFASLFLKLKEHVLCRRACCFLGNPPGDSHRLTEKSILFYVLRESEVNGPEWPSYILTVSSFANSQKHCHTEVSARNRFNPRVQQKRTRQKWELQSSMPPTNTSFLHIRNRSEGPFGPKPCPLDGKAGNCQPWFPDQVKEREWNPCLDKGSPVNPREEIPRSHNKLISTSHKRKVERTHFLSQ